MFNREDWFSRLPLLRRVAKGEEVLWLNPALAPFDAGRPCPVQPDQVEDAAARLQRFAPFIAAQFPETGPAGGLIESPLQPIPQMAAQLRAQGLPLQGQLLLKRDDSLPIAGSVKARGGIYEVLHHAEQMALAAGLLDLRADYRLLATPALRRFFAGHQLQVGSTGNLGLSIGIMGAAFGFETIVHMSADAREWKKQCLRRHGVTVCEYADDYSHAVQEGRARSARNPNSYFVDDENSVNLFLGYAVAGRRVAAQLEALGVAVDGQHPLFCYLPCGVGGAPGGIAFGLKLQFGDFVHCFFAEPTQAPCMLLGMATGLHQQVCVQDIGLTGRTHADGLAVGRPSGFVGQVMQPLLAGDCTVEDARLYEDMRLLWQSEGVFLEPSACAGFQGVRSLFTQAAGARYLERLAPGALQNATHLVWATGGGMVPDQERQAFLHTVL